MKCFIVKTRDNNNNKKYANNNNKLLTAYLKKDKLIVLNFLIKDLQNKYCSY
jgi:hypothetical protein